MLQEQSGEIWGRPPFGSLTPTVQAYRRALLPGERGVEFYTDVRPDSDHPFEARWRAGSPGVRVEDGWAKIACFVVRNTQERGR